MTDIHLSRTDRQQSVLGNARVYPPYGALSGAPGARLAYCGQLREVLTGVYQLGNGYRIFNPLLMRFHSPDRLSPFDKGGMNAYAYCQGDPINYSDPSGRTVTSRAQYQAVNYGASMFISGVGAADIIGHSQQRVSMAEYTSLRNELIDLGYAATELGPPVGFWEKRKLELTIATDLSSAVLGGWVFKNQLSDDLDISQGLANEGVSSSEIITLGAAIAFTLFSKATNNLLGVNKKDYSVLVTSLQEKKDRHYSNPLLRDNADVNARNRQGEDV